ncbi:FadR/GntR family transcriptional regulator [Actinokineospora sp. G85]|uniref:FadR/GntR family transcriptional regulator n=1 Tax=Actinokineospora sp. G85 TaxID=3406626 RepID=UPI003C731BE8
MRPVTSGLPAQLLATLGTAIVNGDLPPGAVVRTEEVERTHGVSRTVVREALRVLEAIGLVSSRRRVGITVLGRDEWNLLDPLVIRWRLAGPHRAEQLRSLNALRAAVEPMAARLAAHVATPDSAAELTRLAVSLRASAHDREVFSGHEIAFHQHVLAMSGNEMFAKLADVLAEVGTHHHPDVAAVELRSRVAACVARGDGPGAETAMRAIVDQAGAEPLGATPRPRPSR